MVDPALLHPLSKAQNRAKKRKQIAMLQRCYTFLRSQSVSYFNVIAYYLS